MSMKVDTGKLEELSAKLKTLGNQVENSERRVYQDLSRLVQDVRSEYDERSVQRALDEVNNRLRNITKLAKLVTDELYEKAGGLKQAAQAYLDSEEAANRATQQKFIPPSSYYSKDGVIAGEGSSAYLKDPLFEDPVVQKLHAQTLNGTEEGQEEAKRQLDKIFKARYDIARAQVAYSVYQAFNNKPLMDGAHKEAERLRKVLKDLGISEGFYEENVNLSGLYKESPISACSYDPSFRITKDDKFVPVLIPQDNQYTYLLGLAMKEGPEGAWAKAQLNEIHKLLTEIGRAQAAWHEYKAKNMQNEMNGAHAYAEKLRLTLKEKHSMSSEMVDDADYKILWTGVAGKALKDESRETEVLEKLDLTALSKMNLNIKKIKNKKEKVQALYERNKWLLPYITKDLSNKDVMNSLKKFQQHYSKYKQRYVSVSQKTGVPPELIAAIHWREGSGDFSKYLHNGDPLGKKTVNVPKGIFFTEWEDAAIHALNLKKYVRDTVGIDGSSKDIAKMMTFAEYYNGLGYINHKVNSVYVFSGTNIPLEGKYYKDRVFTYGPVVDKNPGVAIMLLSILEVPSQTGAPSSQPLPSETSKSLQAAVKGIEAAREQVLELAKQFEGKVPYYMDGNRPKYMDPKSPPKAMDCSDFTSAIYRTVLRDLKVGSNIDIGANTGTQIKSGLEVWTKGKEGAGAFDVSDLKQGDLVLFNSPNSSQVGHVGFYLGDGKFIHESGTNKKGGNVKVSELKGYWLTTQKPIAVRRIIGDDGIVYSQNGKKVGSIK
ncbi:C40 family peptidase [Paenibacillus macerans]|uniref:C40 family peptidase n=1 Tax=Paenibacillus macerans TaxID=44252 RepID=UPI0022E4568D|nr:NlpC/P60 family protein [Paenibacillus macerans]